MKGDSIYTFENGGKERGFFCMHLANYLSQEREENQLDPEQFSELWTNRFNKAKAGSCHYKKMCPIYERTAKRQIENIIKNKISMSKKWEKCCDCKHFDKRNNKCKISGFKTFENTKCFCFPPKK